MFLFTFLAGAVPVVLLFRRWLSRQEEKRRNAGEATRRGCSRAPVLPQTGFWGLLGCKWLVEGLRSTKADRGPQYVVHALDRVMGKDVHTVVVGIFDYDLVMTRNPANVQAVLATEAADWDISEHRTASWEPLVGHGIFTSRGEQWKHSRALVRPQFAMQHIIDLGLIERHVQQLIAAINRQQDINAPKGWTNTFDLQPLFYNLTLDVVTEMLYGYSVHSQNPAERVDLPVLPGYDSPDRENIGKHMDAGKWWVETRGAFWKYRWLLPSWWFSEHCAAIHKYAGWFVHLRLQRGDGYLDGLQHQQGAANKDRYVLLHELAKVTQDPVELRSQTLNVLLAGRDTTAALLGWVFYLLARNTDVWDKLRTEVLAKFGQKAPTESEAREFRTELPYLHAVINESLRVAPVIPLNERVALRDTVLPRGGGPDRDQPIFVPKGTQILIQMYAMARRTDIWGFDVEAFRPERWLEDGGRKFGFEFLPFGGGVRQCLGRKFELITLDDPSGSTGIESIG